MHQKKLFLSFWITFIFLFGIQRYSSADQANYFKYHLDDLKDEHGNSIFQNVSSSDLITMTGESIGDNFGYSVSTAGDVNGDGYSDVIVGAKYYNSGMGRAYIFYGGSSMNNIADVTMTGESIGDNFGCSVSIAGDVNGDGYSDVIVGAKYYNSGGRAYIFYGGSSMNNMVDVTLTGYFLFGESVSTVGDFNGDGYSDVIVSTIIADIGPRAFIYLGGSPMNNTDDLILNIGDFNNYFSFSYGDVNGDGYSDVTGNSGSGGAYIYYGDSILDYNVDVTLPVYNAHSISSTGDFNNDGYSDVIISVLGHTYDSTKGKVYVFYGGAAMDNIADVTLTEEAVGDDFGWSVSSAEDVNEDGFSDVLVGAKGFDSNKGKAYIFYGGSSMDNIPDFTVAGGTTGDNFGFSVSTAENLNGDGFHDVIISAPDYDSGKGRAYILLNLFPTKLISPANNSINNFTTINFRWGKLNTAMYYMLNVSTDSTFNNIIIIDTTSIDTTKIINGLQRNTKYFWKIISKTTSGITVNSSVSNFTTLPPIYLNLKVLMEGMYYPLFNQLSRKDTVTALLRDVTSPYSIRDSAKNVIDSFTFSNIYNFTNAYTGIYYIVVKHFNCIETWSKTGGEILINDGYVYNFDFTTSSSKAYGNNLKLKGSKYCIFSGDIDQSGFVDVTDLLSIYNKAHVIAIGNFMPEDLNADLIVDASDVILCYNNTNNLVGVISP